jgi:hypothetical protein
VPGQISFTFDTWMSETRDSYLSVTGHYISAPKERPQDWELKSEQLAFTAFEGNHSGANMASVLIEIIDRYGIHNKVCADLGNVDDGFNSYHILYLTGWVVYL